MASITDICNAALSHIGTRSKITSIDEESAEASACTTHFAMVRDATLRGHDWGFARITQVLATLENPPQRWAYKYSVPVDCIAIRRLNDLPLILYPETLYERASERDASGAYVDVILTNQAQLSAIYTARVTDPLRWDAGFVDAVSYGLGSRIAFELTGKEDRQVTLTKLWQAMLAEARAENSNEQSQLNRFVIPEAVSARGYGVSAIEMLLPPPYIVS